MFGEDSPSFHTVIFVLLETEHGISSRSEDLVIHDRHVGNLFDSY